MSTYPPAVNRTSFKCLLLGDYGAGKTSLFQRISKDKFSETPSKTAVNDFCTITFLLSSGEEVEMELWDTAGHERFRSLTASYYKNAKSVFLLYDVTVDDARTQLNKWMKDISLYAEFTGGLTIFVVGTKLDLARDPRQAGQIQIDIQGQGVEGYCEISSKTGQNVLELCLQMCEAVTNKRKSGGIPADPYPIIKPRNSISSLEVTHVRKCCS